MDTIINRERLAATFIELCEIDSPSQKEGKISTHLRKIFADLGAESIYEDNSPKETGAESGNLIVRFAGKGAMASEESFLLTSHMDTVNPAKGVKVERNGDIFTSAGNTILGGDDKAGLAAMIELIKMLNENGNDHPPIELVITVCEELGLVGAKSLEFDKIQSKYGYALDASGIDKIIIGAPAAVKFEITVTGKAAHAGLAPESGVSAINLAVKALAKLENGRLDPQSTRNFGEIEGGVSFNIIPEVVKIRGEVRSHSQKKFRQYIEEIHQAFESEIESWEPTDHTQGIIPKYEFKEIGGYPALKLKENSKVISHVKKAESLLGRDLEYIISGGGSDANIFFDHGIPTAIIASAMNKVHTVDECLDLNELVKLVELLFALALVKRFK